MSGFVRTVLGDVPADSLGKVDAHGHIIIDSSYAHIVNPELKIDSVEKAVAEVTDYRINGIGTIIDAMPCDAGRNVLKLAEISETTGVNIVAPTGLHTEKYYPLGHWRYRYDVERLAELFILDIQLGIDRYDYCGPLVERTNHKAGLIKVGTLTGEINPNQRQVFAAAAIAHRETGAPVMTHIEHGELIFEQIGLLRDLGVAPAHTVLSHTDRIEDIGLHREILSTGVTVAYDGHFRWRDRWPNPTIEIMRALFADYPTQIMVGMDAARFTYWKAYGGQPGFSYLTTTLIDILREQGMEEMIKPVLVDNPANTFQFI